MRAIEFNKKVWAALKKIPRGYVTTYQEIARYAGRPKAARAVGNGCAKNPDAPQVPCHRVVKSSGEVGGYARGQKEKIKILRREGIIIKSGKVVDFKKKLWRFKI